MPFQTTGRVAPRLLGLSMLAVLALAACAGASTGSTPEPTAQPSASAAPVSPTPAPSESAEAPSEAPSTSPEASPSASAELPIEFAVDLTIATDHDVTAEVVDWTGTLTGATSGTPGDGASIESGTVAIRSIDASTLELTWTGGPCDREIPVVIDAATASITVVQPPCEGDAIAFDRVLVLAFGQPTDAASFTGVLQEAVDTPA